MSALLFVAVVIQVGLAGYGAFHAIHSAEHGSITKKAIEHGFTAHVVLGTIIVIVMLVLVIVALIGRLHRRYLHLSGGLLLLGILAAVFGSVSSSAPAIGFLHTVTALAIFTASGLLAHRAGAEGRRTAAATVAAH